MKSRLTEGNTDLRHQRLTEDEIRKDRSETKDNIVGVAGISLGLIALGFAAFMAPWHKVTNFVGEMKDYLIHPKPAVEASANPGTNVPKPVYSDNFAILVEGSGAFLPGVYSSRNAARSLQEMNYLHQALVDLGLPESRIFGPGKETSTVGRLENTLDTVEGRMGEKSTLLVVVANPFPLEEAANKEDPLAINFSPGSYIPLGNGQITFTDSPSPSRVNISDYLTKGRTVVVINAYGQARSEVLVASLSGIPNIKNALTVYLGQKDSLEKMTDRMKAGEPLGEVFSAGGGYSPRSTFFNESGNVNHSGAWPQDLYDQIFADRYKGVGQDNQSSIKGSYQGSQDPAKEVEGSKRLKGSPAYSTKVKSYNHRRK